MGWNPIRAAYDSLARANLKKQLLQVLRVSLREVNQGMGLADPSFYNPNDRAAAERAGIIGPVIEEIVRESNGRYAIVQWASGPAIVLQDAVDDLPDDIREKNRRVGIIITGKDF